MLSVLHVGLESVEFVCGMSFKRNTRQTPEEPPVRCHHWTPYSIPLLTALRRFDIAFRVAGFVRVGLTALPQIIQPPCEGLGLCN